ncbi:hypothetical protein L7F22_063903 [Adiantum nelumboides]|nr:hypothetical protein [Adiantum nelumboides]
MNFFFLFPPKPFERNEKVHRREQVSKDSKGNGSKGKKDKVPYKGTGKLSPEEMERYKKEKRCYKCGETGHISRACPKRQQRKETPQATQILYPTKEAKEASQLCFAWGKVRDMNSLILFDPGSTHNFISIELAQKLGIQTEEIGTTLEASDHSQTLEEHKKHLQSVFDELQANRLFVNGKKSEFFIKEIKNLGHIISKEGIRMDPEKLRVIDEWPEPCPLHDLTKKKAKYVWILKENTAFMQLKAKLMTQPLLVLPDLKTPFEVHCDACGDSIGAVLSQEGHPIAYESRRLNSQERGLSVYEKELISVIHALQSWKHYLLGTAFVIYTDHQTDEEVRDIRVAFDKIKESIQSAQQTYKRAADKYRKPLQFKEGDWVLLRFTKARLNMTTGKNWKGEQTDHQKYYMKLAKRYYGPFQILSRINETAYRSKLPAN